MKFAYEGNDIKLTVTAPNETNQLHITYKRSFITKTIKSQGSVIDQYQYPTLDCVVDLMNRQTKYENYYTYNNNSWPSVKYSYIHKDISQEAAVDRYLIGAVSYPGSKTIYEYEKINRNLGTGGLTEDYRIKARYDRVQKYNNTTKVWEWMAGDNNRVNYSYIGDCTGYPDTMSPAYLFASTATDSNGLSIKNIFNGDMQLIQQESTASNNEKIVTKYLTFDGTYKYLPTKTETSKYASDGAVVQTLYTGQTYTPWGGLSTSTAPLTNQQYNDSNIKAKYTTSYFYTNTTYKYFLTKKQWYQNDAKLLSESYFYNTQGKISGFTNTKGEITSYTYSTDTSNNNIVETTQNLESGKIARSRSVYGSETGYAYPKEVINYYTDDQGKSAQIKVSYTYNMLLGLVSSETDNANKKTSYTYDNMGRIVKIQYPDYTRIFTNEAYSVVLNYVYEDGGYADYTDNYYDGIHSGVSGTVVRSNETYTNKNTNVTSYYNQLITVYDEYGNLRQTQKYDGTKYIIDSKYSYDSNQRITASTNAEGYTITQSYNVWGQAAEITDAYGLYVSGNDFRNNRTVSFFVAKANIANYRANINSNTYKEDCVIVNYDQFGRPVSKNVYENWPNLSGELSELYTYDISGNLVSYTDPKRNLNEDGYTERYKYDELNRIIEVKDAESHITSVNYNVLGEITGISLKENTYSTTSIPLYTKSYNELGSLISKTDPSASTTRYTYNNIGLNAKITDRNGSTLTNTYDGLNRLVDSIQVSPDGTSNINHQYGYSNPYGYDEEWLYLKGTLATSNTYKYNTMGLPIQKNVSGSNCIASVQNMQYDNIGQLKSLGVGVGSKYFYSNYSYTYGRLTRVQTNGLQAATSSNNEYATYDYYPDGKLKIITYPVLANGAVLTSEYKYNALGRMTSVSNKRGSTVLSQYTYSYDANGNIISINDGKTTKTYVYDKLNRLVEIRPQNGRNITYTYDLRGNRQTKNSPDLNLELNMSGRSYTYDLENKLSATTINGNTTSMSYYADGLRAKKQTGTNYTSYVYNQSGNLVAEAQNSSAITSNYVWGPDRVLSKKDVSGGEYYYLYNGHGDVIQIVDRNGNVVNNYEYDEWGNILTSNETVSNPFKYAGEVYDQETGLYYLRARYYDPSIGRFINEDTYEGQIDNPLSLNLYSYCYNNPLIYNDPSGNGPEALALLNPEVALVYATGVVIYVTYEYLISPAGEKAIHDGGVAIYNGAVIAGKALTKAAKATAEGIINGATWVGEKIVDGASWLGDKVADAWSGFTSLFKKKPVNLPSIKKLTIDMEHIVSGHTSNGNRRDPNGNKGVFYGMTAEAINKAIKEAYGSCEKITTQGERILVRGFSKTYDIVIEMWVNVKDYVIETAYPLD